MHRGSKVHDFYTRGAVLQSTVGKNHTLATQLDLESVTFSTLVSFAILPAEAFLRCK
jgi:hypothetical protein